MACPDVSRCDYACLRRGVCDHQGVWKAGMDWAATLAICAFDDRCRMRSQNLDWDEGFHAGTQAAAKAIRAALTASPAGDDPKALDAVARADEIERVYDYLQVRDEALGVDTDEVERKVSAEEIVAVARQIRDAEARSSSTEAVEQERPTGHFAIDHDGFAGTVIGHYTTLEGKQGVVLQQDGTRVVHVYGEKWLKPADAVTGSLPGAAVEQEVERLREALRFYADPARYKPHPHGPAFDKRDLSYVAVAALAPSLPGKEEGRG